MSIARGYRTTLGFIIIAGISALAVIAFDRWLTPATIGPDPCTGETADDILCWDSYYQTLSRDDGARSALADLKARYHLGGPARAYCHTLLHTIGKKAADEFGDIATAYRYGDTFCRSGYHHGVLEGVFAKEGNADFLKNLDAICAGVPGKERYSYAYYSCVHGIGHGLMAYYYHDVFKSLEGCDNLTPEWERSSCYGGVFMENVIADSPEHPSKFLNDDPLYPCNAVDDRYRYQCYLMQTSHMLVLNGGNFADAFDTCSRAEATYRTTCYQSLGRDASGWSYGNSDTALALCAQGETLEARSECLTGAAVDFIQSVGPVQAQALCAQGEAGAREVCAKNLEQHIRSL